MRETRIRKWRKETLEGGQYQVEEEQENEDNYTEEEEEKKTKEQEQVEERLVSAITRAIRIKQ